MTGEDYPGYGVGRQSVRPERGRVGTSDRGKQRKPASGERSIKALRPGVTGNMPSPAIPDHPRKGGEKAEIRRVRFRRRRIGTTAAFTFRYMFL